MRASIAPVSVFLFAVFLSTQLQQVIGALMVTACVLVAAAMRLAPIDWKHPIPAEETSRVRSSRVFAAAFLLVLYFAVSPMIWRRSLVAVATKGDQLGDAITRYESDHGAPPKNLRALVPDYLSDVPSTGLRSSRQFYYSTSGERGDWTLTLPTSRGFLSGDVLKRNADKAYDSRGEWGDGEVVAGWLYQID